VSRGIRVTVSYPYARSANAPSDPTFEPRSRQIVFIQYKWRAYDVVN